MSASGPTPDPVRGGGPGKQFDDIRELRGSFIGMTGLVCMPFLIFGAHAAYGWITAVGLVVFTLFLFSLAFVWFMHYPKWVAWLPVIGFLSWLAAVLISR